MKREVQFSKEKMRERFEFLKTEIERIESTSPRVERDEKIAELNPNQLAAFDTRIAQHEEGLFDLKQEFAFLARGLGGRVMSEGKS